MAGEAGRNLTTAPASVADPYAVTIVDVVGQQGTAQSVA